MNLREELERKNTQMEAFLTKQVALEQKLQRIQEVLMYPDSEGDDDDATTGRSTSKKTTVSIK